MLLIFFFLYLCSGKTIGSVRDVNGLYYFEGDIVMSAQAQATSSEISFCVEDEIMLWHHRLGPLSFPYLKNLFPLLFKNKNRSLFQCKIC